MEGITRGFDGTYEENFPQDSGLIRDQVADFILGMIFSGELKGNDRISERQIGKVLNVSTMPIKEAFRILQNEGFLYSVPRKGTYIAEFPEDIALQTVCMRQALEGIAVRYAARHIREEAKTEIRALLERSRQILEREKQIEFSEAELTEALDELFTINYRFHRLIRLASGNGFLARMTEFLQTMEMRFRKRALWLSREERERSCREHEMIFEAVSRGDGDAAEELIRAHLSRNMTLLGIDERKDP